MKRYYSHYTFIYPNIYIKNYIVEMDDNRRIIRVFPYSREVEKTEFYSGLLAFLPDNIPFTEELLADIKKLPFSGQERIEWQDVSYKMYIED